MSEERVVRRLLAENFDHIFFCPGCRCGHGFNAYLNKLPRWQFNGEMDRPTLSPSLLMTSSKLTDAGRADYFAWCDAGYPERTAPFETVPLVCHSFVTEGQIQFLSDCTHELAGQTVALEPF